MDKYQIVFKHRNDTNIRYSVCIMYIIYYLEWQTIETCLLKK